MLDVNVKNYLSNAKGVPFFYVVGDGEYLATLDELKQNGASVIRISDFCKKPDKFPNLDDMVEVFRTGDVDYKSNKFVVVGLGEYLALRGEDEALNILYKLKDITLGSARVVLLLRCVAVQVDNLAREDIRVKSRVYISNTNDSKISVVNVGIEQSVGLVKEVGLQSLLRAMEDGKAGKLFVKTNLIMDDSMLPIDKIDDAYSAIKILSPGFLLPKSLGDDEQWGRLLGDLKKCNYSLSKFFEDFHLDSDADFIEKAFGFTYSKWIYFIYLKLNYEKLSNPYLSFVIRNTDDFKKLKTETLNAIKNVKHTDKQFNALYAGRKKILKDIPESDIAAFIRQDEIYPDESIYRLTDNTLAERKAIIRWVSKHGKIKEIEQIYPALFSYLQKYTFTCGKDADKLTDYFERYKRQKISNAVDDGFEEYAKQNSSLYAGLQTRANALMNVEGKESTFLLWIDALGVEYLSYIQMLAKQMGLSIHIEVARADLPTITGINKRFFEEWNENKYKDPRLDDIKHQDCGGYDYNKEKLPVYLASELDVIKDALNRAATELAYRNYKQFVIVSDHGASRLAVLGQHREKYETDTKGEHSGRCCKYFDDYDLSNSVAENGYIILTDYGRFKGSREANVEVHGGCTLEETVVPVITLSLNNQTDVQIIVINADKLIFDRKNSVQVLVYISAVESPKSIRMEIKDKSYYGEQTDEMHYKFALIDIKRADKYVANIFDGSNLIGQVNLNIKSAVASLNPDFDNLF